MNEALRRLYGTPDKFGHCHQCGQEIAFERLDALPHARLCITCKEKGGRWQAPLSRRPAVLDPAAAGGRVLDLITKLVAEAALLRTPGVAGPRRLVPAPAGLQPGRGVRPAPRAVLALDLLHHRDGRGVRAHRMSRTARPATWFRQLALGLVAGGAAGNLIDRIRSARGVVDFLDVGIGALRWPTFNVADIAVSCGAIALVISMWRGGSATRGAGVGLGGVSEPAPSSSPSPRSADSATERLDRFLADQLGLSRTQAARLVADKAVTVNGRQARASRALTRGERGDRRVPRREPPRTLSPPPSRSTWSTRTSTSP